MMNNYLWTLSTLFHKRTIDLNYYQNISILTPGLYYHHNIIDNQLLTLIIIMQIEQLSMDLYYQTFTQIRY